MQILHQPDPGPDELVGGGGTYAVAEGFNVGGGMYAVAVGFAVAVAFTVVVLVGELTALTVTVRVGVADLAPGLSVAVGVTVLVAVSVTVGIGVSVGGAKRTDSKVVVGCGTGEEDVEQLTRNSASRTSQRTAKPVRRFIAVSSGVRIDKRGKGKRANLPS